MKRYIHGQSVRKHKISLLVWSLHGIYWRKEKKLENSFLRSTSHQIEKLFVHFVKKQSYFKGVPWFLEQWFDSWFQCQDFIRFKHCIFLLWGIADIHMMHQLHFDLSFILSKGPFCYEWLHLWKGKCCKVCWEEGGFCGLFVALLSCFRKCSHRLQVNSTADFQIKQKFCCFSLRCGEMSEHLQ